MKADLEKLVPNMKARDRLQDVEDGLQEAEKEADATRKESKRARDQFLDLKKQRSVLSPWILSVDLAICADMTGATCSTGRSTTCPA